MVLDIESCRVGFHACFSVSNYVQGGLQAGVCAIASKLAGLSPRTFQASILLS